MTTQRSPVLKKKTAVLKYCTPMTKQFIFYYKLLKLKLLYNTFKHSFIKF